MKHQSLCSLLIALALSLAAPASPQARDVGGQGAQQVLASGMNIANPQRLPADEQARLLDGLVANGVKLIRAPLLGYSGSPEDVTPAIDFIARAHALGIKTLVNVYPVATDAPRRPYDKRYPNQWAEYPLSHADPIRSAAIFARAMQAFDRLGVKIAGVEVGNELNYTAFNGDFPLPGKGNVYDYDDLTSLPELAGVAKGFRNYINVVRAIRRQRDASRLNAGAPIVSAGLADPGKRDRGRKNNVDAVTIPATLKYMREHGLDEVVDAYGLHTYRTARQLTGAGGLQEVFGACQPPGGGAGKPCWLTEWGYKSSQLACNDASDPRVDKIREFEEIMGRLRAERRLASNFYFHWTGDDDYTVYRCGAVTSGGRLLYQPGH